MTPNPQVNLSRRNFLRVSALAGGGMMPGYMAAPAKKAGKLATIMVIPEIFGMHEYQKDICRRLAGAGYLAVTLDPFFRSGDLAKMTDIKEVIAKANSLEDKQMLADLDAVVAVRFWRRSLFRACTSIVAVGA